MRNSKLTQCALVVVFAGGLVAAGAAQARPADSGPAGAGVARGALSPLPRAVVVPPDRSAPGPALTVAPDDPGYRKRRLVARLLIGFGASFIAAGGAVTLAGVGLTIFDRIECAKPDSGYRGCGAGRIIVSIGMILVGAVAAGAIGAPLLAVGLKQRKRLRLQVALVDPFGERAWQARAGGDLPRVTSVWSPSFRF